MKLAKIFNLNNIKSYVEGNLNYYYNNIVGLPEHIQEQTLYRLSLCKNDCVEAEECVYCSCPPKKKVFVTKSCNNGERFPDLMEEQEWEAYKKENNIYIK